MIVAVALAALSAWWAARIVSRNLVVLSSWKRSDGVVTNLAAGDWVEIEPAGTPDATRVRVPIDHKLGLVFLKRVSIYADPADPSKMRIGGLFQLWLWPAALLCATAVLLIGSAGVATVGRSATTSASVDGHWHCTPPPLPLITEVRVYRPAPEWRAPLFWSLLGFAALALGVFLRSGTPVQRTLLGALGLIFALLMFGLALNNKTTEVSADSTGMCKTTAFGWCQIRWSQVGSVQRQRTIFGRPMSMLRKNTSDTFPGREVTQVVSPIGAAAR